MNSNELANSLTFPIKLKKIVDATETDHLICWDEDGLSFHITDDNQFARDIIPNYFKHSNIASFIRQLNNYGFHKMNRIDNGMATSGSGNDDSQWVHPNFVRDKPELLNGVVRKITNNAPNSSLIINRTLSNNPNEMMPYDSVKGDVARLAKMVQFLKKRDEETTEQLKLLQEENNELYSELMFLREQHEQQSKCIEMLIEFFSQYAKKPHTLTQRLRPKRNILALECTKTQSTNSNSNEPPRKFLVTSTPQQPVATCSNETFKGKKVIKISNLPKSHVDVNTPKTINSLNNSNLYHNLNPQKLPVIYKVSLNNNSNTAPKIIRAITASNSTPSVVIPQATMTSQHSQNQNTKTVTVSTVNADPKPIHNGNNFKQSASDDVGFRQSAPRISPTNVNHGLTSNILSGISSNVISVDQCLNDIHDMFGKDQPYYSMENYNQSSTSDIDSFPDEDWQMLLESITPDAMSKDRSRIHGHELIPFTGSTGEASDPNNDNQDTYSIDDLLQTPDINPGMSSLSLDYMDDQNFSPPNIFNDDWHK